MLACEYSTGDFEAAAVPFWEEPEGGKRCNACFELRLTETAKLAKAGGYDCFTTTLSVSPHKNAELLNKIGSRLAGEYGVEYLYSDFKKCDGYKRSIELSRQFGLYRQSYCGCLSEHG
jgi:predicted adenine nucleotide alpha hydrolase (AANH) superfamily ATPase